MPKSKKHIAVKKEIAHVFNVRVKAIHSLVPYLDSNLIRCHIFRRNRKERKELIAEKKKLVKEEPEIRKMTGRKSHKSRVRLSTHTVEEVHEWVKNPEFFKRGKPYVRRNNINISLARIVTLFQIGFECKHCPQIGTKFCLERNESKIPSYHLDLYSDDDTMMTIDHKVPRSKGGKDEVSNFQCLCHVCNGLKGNNHCD